MTKKPRPQAKPKAPETEAPPKGNGDAPDRQKPPPDGEAIAEVGDAVGGPA